MDKYENNLKLDQIKSLLADEKYEAAADIVDSMNWNKIRNVNALVKAAEVYEKLERYDDCLDLLLMAYDRSPIGRMIVYKLTEVYIKMGDFSEAEEYYKEFLEIAPHDSLRFILKYNIRKNQGASHDELIPILEEFKDQEYTEEWAYELAYMYHKAGSIEKCIDACDELILWFGDGPYVERALELKMLYQPLTKLQEEKYRKFRLEREGMTIISEAEMERVGTTVNEPVVIPQVEVNPEKFNTVNLQEEIAKGMQQIMNATEKETVSDTIDNLMKITEEIPYLQLPRDESEKPDLDHIETDEEIDGDLKQNFQDMLDEESDGQISLMVDDQPEVEEQITGQMSIQDILDEWEKTRRAAEAALQDAEQRKLESAKARALIEAEDLMERLNGVIPKLDAGVTPKELLEEEYMQEVANEETISAPVDEISEKVLEELDIEPDSGSDEADDDGSAEETVDEGTVQIIVEDSEEESETESEAAETAAEEIEEIEEVEEIIDSEDIEEVQNSEEVVDVDEVLIDMDEIVLPDVVETVEVTVAPEEDDVVVIEDEEEDDEAVPAETIVLPKISIPEDIEIADELKEPEEEKSLGVTRRMPAFKIPVFEEDPVKNRVIKPLTPEQKEIFSYFIPVIGMEDQICAAMSTLSTKLNNRNIPGTGNLIIQGERGCGKTVLAQGIIKALQIDGGHPNGKIGKVDAGSLNNKEPQPLLKKVAGGCLIIEKAGEINKRTAVALGLLMANDRNGTVIILEDTSKGIKKALAQDDAFASLFTDKISIPIFTNDELVAFARVYAEELGYEIDEMAVLALYNRISNIQRLDQATTLTEIKDIVDEAIERESRGGLKKAFSIITAKRYTDDDRIVLSERHFEDN